MELKDLLAGGLIGIIAKELFQLFVSKVNHTRERDKLFYTSKLKSSEKLIGLYVAYYYQVRTIIECFTTARVMIENPDEYDLDYDAILAALLGASIKCVEIDSKIQDEGASAYLYVDINSTWRDADFKEIFDLGNLTGPKVERYNELLLSDDYGNEFQNLKLDILQTLDTAINSYTKFKNSVEETINQLKTQAKP